MYVTTSESDNCIYKISIANTMHMYVFYSVMYLPKHGYDKPKYVDELNNTHRYC